MSVIDFVAAAEALAELALAELALAEPLALALDDEPLDVQPAIAPTATAKAKAQAIAANARNILFIR